MLTNLFTRQNILPLAACGFATVALGIGGLAQVARSGSAANSSSVPYRTQAESAGQNESAGGYRYGNLQGTDQMPPQGPWQGNIPQNPYSAPAASTPRNAPGYNNAPVSGYTPGYTNTPGTTTPDNSSDDITSGYWARQRTQDQEAQAFDGYINDTTTIRDTDTNEIHTDVSNDIANPAIENGTATEVPTADLPTSYDSTVNSSSSSSTSSDSSSSE